MTHEEAIKNINALNAVCCEKDFYDAEFENALALAIDAIKKQATQEWISVKDRLPEPWKQVLIYSQYDFCEVALYIGIPGKWRVTWNHDMLDADSVTHWMPLPQPPKGE